MQTIISRIIISFLATMSFFLSAGSMSEVSQVPESIFELYREILKQPKLNFDIRKLEVAGEDLKVVKRIPKAMTMKNGQVKGALKNENLMIIQFEPEANFLRANRDVHIWNFMYDQVEPLKDKNYIESGFVNNGSTIFYIDFTYNENGKRRRAIYCVSIHGNSVIEIIYSERTNPDISYEI